MHHWRHASFLLPSSQARACQCQGRKIITCIAQTPEINPPSYKHVCFPSHTYTMQNNYLQSDIFINWNLGTVAVRNYQNLCNPWPTTHKAFELYKGKIARGSNAILAI